MHEDHPSVTFTLASVPAASHLSLCVLLALVCPAGTGLI